MLETYVGPHADAKAYSEACSCNAFITERIRTAKRISLVGPIGSGKSTYAKHLCRMLDIPYISTGDVLRNPDKYPWIRPIIGDYDVMAGRLLEQSKVDAITKRVVEEEGPNGWVLDGYPRLAGGQVEYQLKNFPPDIVILLDCPEQTSIQRISGRRYHKPSGRVYNIYSNPPKVEGLDDVTGEPLSIREDDAEAVIIKRLEDYKNKTLPMVDELINHPEVLVVKIDVGFEVLFPDGS